VCLWMTYGVAPDQLRTDDFHRRVEVQLRQREVNSGGSGSSSRFWMNEGGGKQAPKDSVGAPKHLYRLSRPRNKWGISYNLTASTFFDNVVHTPSHWLVWFKSFGNDKNTNNNNNNEEEEGNGARYAQRLDAWNKAAKLMKGKVQFGTVSAYEHADEILASIGLDDSSSRRKGSSILLFPARTMWGNKKSKVQASMWLHEHTSQEKQQNDSTTTGHRDKFTLNTSNATDIVHFASSLFGHHSYGDDDDDKSDAVVFRIDNSEPSRSIQAWLADGSKKPRLLLFPSKDVADNVQVPTLLQALAIEYGHIMHCALARRSDEKLAEQAQVTKFPAVRILSTTRGLGRFGEMQITDYEEDINFNSLARFFDSNTRMVAKHYNRNKDEL